MTADDQKVVPLLGNIDEASRHQPFVSRRCRTNVSDYLTVMHVQSES